MNASEELRSLSGAELDEVSGAKTNSYDLGILGTIIIDDKCWEYRLVHAGSDGSISWQTRGACSGA